MMQNGHLPNHMAWTAYKLQLWPGLGYGLGTMTSNLEATESIFNKADFEMMPIFGVARTVKQELRKLHTTFGGFGLFHLPTEQLICRLNMLLQHYHTSTALSKKMDASFKYLQLQLVTPYNPLTLPFNQWGNLAPLSWVKMLWQSLDTFNIQLHMKYPPLLFPQERDQVIMEIILDKVFSATEVQSISWCWGSLQCIFLSDLVTVDGRYLESFVFELGPPKKRSTYHFPHECPTKKDWDIWFNFWHNYATTGGKLKVPLGRWTHPTHRKWLWYSSSVDDLHRVENRIVHHYLPSQSRRLTRSDLGYSLAWTEPLRTNHVIGLPVSVQGLDSTCVYKLNTGTTLARGSQQPSNFGEYLRAWGGEWMWGEIEDGQATKRDLTWLFQGMKSNTLVWVTDGSYDRKRAPLLSGVGWIIFCQDTGKRLVGSFWEKSLLASSYRAELLSLCALHLLAKALADFYKTSGWKATLCCNNLQALQLSSQERQQIKPSAACSDLHRSLCSTKNNFTGCFRYQHVAGHMDKYLLWHQLSLVQ